MCEYATKLDKMLLAIGVVKKRLEIGFLYFVYKESRESSMF